MKFFFNIFILIIGISTNFTLFSMKCDKVTIVSFKNKDKIKKLSLENKTECIITFYVKSYLGSIISNEYFCTLDFQHKTISWSGEYLNTGSNRDIEIVPFTPRVAKMLWLELNSEYNEVQKNKNNIILTSK